MKDFLKIIFFIFVAVVIYYAGLFTAAVLTPILVIGAIILIIWVLSTDTDDESTDGS